jgi:hypothetical protein
MDPGNSIFRSPPFPTHTLAAPPLYTKLLRPLAETDATINGIANSYFGDKFVTIFASLMYTIKRLNIETCAPT